MRFKFFIVGSLIAHILMLGLLQLLPYKPPLSPDEKPLIARLVRPEDLVSKKEPEPPKPPITTERQRLPIKPPPLTLKPEREIVPIPSGPEREILPDEIPPETMEDEFKGLKPDKLPGTGTKPGESPGTQEEKGESPSTFREELKVAEKKAIDKIVAESEEGEKQGKGDEGGSAITFSTKEFKYYGYKTRLKEKIEGIWKYPREAAARGIYGDLVIQFTILRDGTLGAVELQRTSGYKMLDDAAMKALRDAAPFWPLPKEWKEETFTIRGHFVYTLGGYYIR